MFLAGHCDSVTATLLMELGQWSEAEAVLVRAKINFETAMQGAELASGHRPRRPAHPTGSVRRSRGPAARQGPIAAGPAPGRPTASRRGDHDLARAAALRGLRVIGDDRLRAAELLTVLVDAQLAQGEIDEATATCAELNGRVSGLDISPLRARAAAAHARVLAAAGDVGQAIAHLETTVDQLDTRQLPWLRAALLIDLARLRDQTGDTAGATLDAKAAGAALAALDVVVTPDDVALLERLGPERARAVGLPPRPPSSHQRGKWWVASFGGSSVRLPDTKGLRYLAELIACPGSERHALDLVDRVEGVAPSGGIDRRALGDAGTVLDAQARLAYRHRIERLRADADDALASDQLETAEACQAELDQLVSQLARAYGLGGRDRRSASAAERARLNVTRALRSAIAKLIDTVPEAGAGARSAGAHGPLLRRTHPSPTTRCDGSFSPD